MTLPLPWKMWFWSIKISPFLAPYWIITLLSSVNSDFSSKFRIELWDSFNSFQIFSSKHVVWNTTFTYKEAKVYEAICHLISLNDFHTPLTSNHELHLEFAFEYHSLWFAECIARWSRQCKWDPLCKIYSWVIPILSAYPSSQQCWVCIMGIWQKLLACKFGTHTHYSRFN